MVMRDPDHKGLEVDSKMVIGVENKVTYLDDQSWTHQQRTKDLEIMSGKRVGFEATSPRFNINQCFYGTSLKIDQPGPGQYPHNEFTEECVPRPATQGLPRSKNMKAAVIFNSSDRRFKQKGLTSFYHPGAT